MLFKLEDYQFACKTAANLVANFGDAYLPIFERTYKELKQAQQTNSLKAVALQFARDQSPL